MSQSMGDEAGTRAVADSEIVSVLRRLAGRESRAIRSDTGEGFLVSLRNGPGERHRCGGNEEIDAAVWQRMLDSGLIVPDGEDGSGAECWRISNAGRIHLRRRLSRSPDQGEVGQGEVGQGEVGQGEAGQGEAGQASGGIGGRAQPCDEPDGVIAAPSESPLAWLARRRDKAGRTLISQDEFHAGERLRADFTMGQMMEKVTSSWSPMAGYGKRGQALDGELSMSEAGVDARERVRAALADVGPELSGVLVDVCCYLKGLEVTERAAGWPQRSGKLILQMALRALVRHYKSQRRNQSADAA